VLHLVAPLHPAETAALTTTHPTAGDIAFGYESHRRVAFHFKTRLQDG
jgi:hypothetical protein